MSDYDIGKAFEKIENELIASMIRNLSRHRAEESKLGIEWSQWQVEQLKALEVYKRKNSKRFTVQYNSINEHIRRALNDSYNDGGTKQERQILQAIKRGFKGKEKNKPAFTGAAETTGEFFKTNERKLNSLIKATTHDMKKAEIAVLRMANDQYRKVIFNAQVMANTGAGTYVKAVDMATKDFLSTGINCIQYRNGRRVNIKSYAEMALRTANKRAYLQGEGAKRQEWGIYTVILNKRGNPCPLCAPFVCRVFIDDVWSGGPKNGISPVTGVKYPLLSEAIKKGLYHPNCRDAHTTYFEGISTPPENSRYTADELDELAERYNNAQKQNYAQNEAERMERMSKFSLDKDNKRAYSARAEQWRVKAEELEKTVENSDDNDIIEIGNMPLQINLQLFAKIPEEKFTKYALDPIRQPDKARAFRDALGYTIDNYQELIENIQTHFDESSMMLKAEDKFGKRYELVMNLTGANGKTANVCTAWIKENENAETRLTSVYVTKKKVTGFEN